MGLNALFSLSLLTSARKPSVPHDSAPSALPSFPAIAIHSNFRPSAIEPCRPLSGDLPMLWPWRREVGSKRRVESHRRDLLQASGLWAKVACESGILLPSS